MSEQEESIRSIRQTNLFIKSVIDGGNSSRDIVRWLFDADTKPGTVAPTVYVYEDEVNYYNSKYVVAALSKVYKKGTANAGSVMDQIEAPVKNQKRAEFLKSKINSTDLNGLAQQFETSVDTAENVTYGAQFISGIGDEPKVLAAAYALEPGQKSEVIEGKNSLFVIELMEKSEPSSPQNIAQLRRQTSFQVANYAEYELLPALKKNADIKDNRYTFF